MRYAIGLGVIVSLILLSESFIPKSANGRPHRIKFWGTSQSIDPDQLFATLKSTNVPDSERYVKLSEVFNNLRAQASNSPKEADIPYKMGLVFLQIDCESNPTLKASCENLALEFFQKAVEINSIRRLQTSPQEGTGEDKVHPEDVLSAYRKAIEATANSLIKKASYNNMIRIKMDQGELDAAARLCDEAVNDNPNDDIAWTNMGIILLKEEAYDWAEKCFQYALASSDAQNSIALNNLGFLYQKRGEYDKAEAFLRSAVAIDDTDDKSAYALAMLLLEREEQVQAKEFFALAVERNPDNEQASFQLRMIEDVLSTSSVTELSSSYIQQLFDFYAASGYDEHMLSGLQYRGPDLIWSAFERAATDSASGRGLSDPWYAVDLGCGSGLVGRVFRSNLPSLTALLGNDLSSAMTDLARAATVALPLEKQFLPSPPSGVTTPVQIPTAGDNSRAAPVYEGVVTDDCASFLDSLITDQRTSLAPNSVRRNVYPWNLVLAGDVLCYLGDLLPVLSRVQTLLAGSPISGPKYFIFTVEELSNNDTGGDGSTVGYRFTESGRFVHKWSYIEDLAGKVGFRIISCEPSVLRKQKQDSVQGLIVTLAVD